MPEFLANPKLTLGRTALALFHHNCSATALSG